MVLVPNCTPVPPVRVGFSTTSMLLEECFPEILLHVGLVSLVGSVPFRQFLYFHGPSSLGFKSAKW